MPLIVENRLLPMTPGKRAYTVYEKALMSVGGVLDRWEYLSTPIRVAWEAVAEAVNKHDTEGNV